MADPAPERKSTLAFQGDRFTRPVMPGITATGFEATCRDLVVARDRDMLAYAADGHAGALACWPAGR